jgi:type IV pilus assembly protein PilE
LTRNATRVRPYLAQNNAAGFQETGRPALTLSLSLALTRVGNGDRAGKRFRSGHLLKTGGITLIELVIVMAVLAIITAIAVPNYQDYVSRSRRADAMIALQRVANEQEQFYFDNNRYSANFTSISVPNTSPDGYYALSLSAVSTTGFTARATPVVGGSQVGTGNFEIRATGQKTWDPGQDGTFECDWYDANRGGGAGC